MPGRRRFLLILAALTALTIILAVRRESLRGALPSDLTLSGASRWLSSVGYGDALPSPPDILEPALKRDNYTRLLVVPTLKEDHTVWFDEEIPEFDKIFYVANDRTAKYHPPKNKGNEVMIYLTYIIDHYDQLPDITIFIHQHRWTWHNNDLLDNDAAQMLRRLSSARIMREGYMNLRCQWDPGCPHGLQPKSDEVKASKQEQLVIAKVWGELFPSAPVPDALSQACCAQFAVTRDAVRRLPISRYVWLRDWMLRTELSNYLAGRCFEYLWQYIFAGRHEVCPSQHACYCDGYGVCFAGEAAFQHWFEVRYFMNERKKELERWQFMRHDYDESNSNGTYDALPEAERPKQPEDGRDAVLKAEIENMRQEMADQKEVALRRGLDPKIRAHESGREWHEGDGY